MLQCVRQRDAHTYTFSSIEIILFRQDGDWGRGGVEGSKECQRSIVLRSAVACSCKLAHIGDHVGGPCGTERERDLVFVSTLDFGGWCHAMSRICVSFSLEAN